MIFSCQGKIGYDTNAATTETHKITGNLLSKGSLLNKNPIAEIMTKTTKASNELTMSI